MNKFDWISKWAGYTPDRIAVEDYECETKYSYSELNRKANQLANYLINEYGIKKGNRIAVISAGRVELIMLFGVAQKIGITIVPLNFRLMPAELEYVITNCEPSVIIYCTEFLEKLEQVNAFTSFEQKLSINSLLDKIEPASDILEYKPQLNEDDPIFILYTSGTTAFPKGALYTHKMLFWNSINTEIRLEITPADSTISVTPPFHTGFWNVLLSSFLQHGAETIIMRRYDPVIIMRLIEERKISIWWAVPTMLKMMSDSEEFAEFDLSSLRYVVVGGEAMPVPLIEIWHNKGVAIRQGYGLTEVGPNITSLPEKDAYRKQGSIGTENFYVDIKLVDENGNEIVGEGEGEFLLSGPNVTPGYWKNPDATKAAITDGWFHTGDVVRRDTDGYYYVVDRIKNMYISGGENVYPAQVEYLIRKHDAVDEVTIIGVPDEKWGEAGKAFVVLKEGMQATEDEIRNFCIANLAKYKVPKYVEFINELPKNDAGKIDRKSLKRKENVK